MVSIYILELMNNKYYVGSTARIEVSMDDVNYHTPWTQKYKPIRILYVIYDCDKYDEDKYTRKYMDDYGLDNVRGGSFSTEHLDPVIRAMLNPKCSIYNNMDSCASEAKTPLTDARVSFLESKITTIEQIHAKEQARTIEQIRNMDTKMVLLFKQLFVMDTKLNSINPIIESITPIDDYQMYV